MALINEDKIPESYRAPFIAKLNDISKKLEIDPNWLMIVFQTESGFNPTIVNGIGCTGLTQFCPDKAGSGVKTIGKTKLVLSDLKSKISPVQQLDYIYEYFKPYQNKIKSFYDLYLYNFYPYAAGKPDSYAIGSEHGIDSAKTIAKQNKILDMNGDGLITLSDYKKFIDNKIKNSGLKNTVVNAAVYAKKTVKDHWIISTGFVVIMGIGAFMIIRSKMKK